MYRMSWKQSQDFWKIMQLVLMYMNWACRDHWPKLWYHTGFDLTRGLFIFSLDSEVGSWITVSWLIRCVLLRRFLNPLVPQFLYFNGGNYSTSLKELLWELNQPLNLMQWATTSIINSYSFLRLPVCDTGIDNFIWCPFYCGHGHHHYHM